MKTLLPMRQQLKVVSLIVLFWMSCGVLLAQNPLVKQWDKRFGGTSEEQLYSVQPTKDGGFILGGFSRSGISGDKTQSNWDTTNLTGDFWVIKVNALGNKQWDKRFGGTKWDWLLTMIQTNDDGYLLGGVSRSGISGNKTQANWNLADTTWDYWIVKIDSSGNYVWDKRFGGTEDEDLWALQQTHDGGYILGGLSFSDISGDKTQPNWDTSKITSDYWIIKIDSLGNKQWDKRYGGVGFDAELSLQLTNDGGYILGGSSGSGISGDKTQDCWHDSIGNPSSDYWIVKIDSIGNKQWDKRFGGIKSDYFSSLAKLSDGGYILGGTSQSSVGGDKTQPMLDTNVSTGWGPTDYWIVKIDSLGNKQWDKKYGGYDVEDDFGTISQTLDGGYLLPGTSYSNICGDKTENNLGAEQTWIVKTDSLGNKQWDKTLRTKFNTWGNDEVGFAFQIDSNCYVAANFTSAGIGGDKTQDTWGGSDYWIIKFCDTTQITAVHENPNTNLQLPISIAPNPNNGSFTVTLNTAVSKDFSIRIINSMGQTIYKKQEAIVNGQSSMVDLSNAAKGLYVAEVINDGKVYRSRFIVQ